MPELSGYYCVTANEMARERRAKLRMLARFAHVRRSVIERIMHGWSPQHIPGRMRLERHPISVSYETIFKFAYSADGLTASAGTSRETSPAACQAALRPPSPQRSISDGDLKELCDRLNSTPRKFLRYRTPAEDFRKKLFTQIRCAG